MPSAVKAVVAEVWQPTQAKTVKLIEIIDSWRGMIQLTYKERRLTAPELSSAYARNRFKDTERRKINTLCHQISREIVKQAKAENAVIVLGDLKGIRSRTRGRRMNRILSAMPYHKLTQQINYKAAWEGITVAKLNERATSKTCHRCGSMNTTRIKQPIFECHVCGLIYNADLNGAMNIAKRFCEQCLRNGATVSWPLTLPERNLNANDEERSQIIHPSKT